MAGVDQVAFVDTIAANPTVRLALTGGDPWRVRAEGTDLSPPPLRRASAGTLLRDGDVYPAAAYEDRILKLRLGLTATTADAQATAVQTLQREIDRPTNFLRWWPKGATNPVFFRTIRSAIGAVNDHPGAGQASYREFDVSVLAESSGYGLKETVGPTTVSNHPGAGGSTPGYFDVTGIKGDVETPAVLTVAASAFVVGNDNVSLIAVRRRGTPSNTPGGLQAESMTLGTDTTLPGNDAAMSGAGSNYARVSFSTTTAMATRLSATHPGSASVDNRGTYRIFARIRRSVGGSDVVKMRLQWGGTSTSLFTNGTVTTTATTNIGYVDLGLVTMPPGNDPVTDGLSGTTLSASGIYLAVQAERTSGTSNLDIDLLWPIPADDRLCAIRWGTASGADNCVADGTTDTVYQTTSGGAVLNANLAQRSGGLPMLSPGVTNRIWLVRQVRQGAPVDSIGNTYNVTLSYFPRYLFVRPAST